VFPVLGVTPGLTACIQVMEALKYLTGVGTPLKGKLLLFDGQDMAFSTVNVSRAAACPDCGGAA
jgi:molybdopterin/thiamine biosynthesis adenylyltransferase